MVFGKVCTSVICGENCLRIGVNVIFTLYLNSLSTCVCSQFFIGRSGISLSRLILIKLDVSDSNGSLFGIKAYGMLALVKVEIKRLVVKSVRILEGGCYPHRFLDLRRTGFVSTLVGSDLVSRLPSSWEAYTHCSIERSFAVDEHRHFGSGIAACDGIIANLHVVCACCSYVNSEVKCAVFV